MKKIKNWEDLSKEKNESKTHILEVDVEYCNAKIIARNKKKTKSKEKNGFYLSTHTFYKENYEFYTELLQKTGFNVELIPCD
jgi:hypothetical protein